MRVRLQHRTRYIYDDPVVLGAHSVRLVPAPRVADQVVTYNLRIDPEPHTQWQHDLWGNRLVRANWAPEERHRHLEIQVDAVIDLKPVNPFDFFVDERCATLPFDYPDGLEHELAPFLARDTVHPRVVEWLDDFDATGPVVDTLVRLNLRVAESVRYLIRTEPGLQSPEETLEKRSGSCRDSAWLLVSALRHLGLAARFTSGYLIQLEDEGDIPGVPRGLSRDVLDLHAWCEAFVPGAGWIGLDGTSGLLTGEGHLPLSCAVVPELAAPVTGTASLQATHFEFDMRVERVGHEPRPRKPYADDEWIALLEAGDRVDASLDDQGLLLTSGGEPTWTTRDEPALPEWNTEALGHGKRRQGLLFADEIRRRFGVGPVVMHRFGKHYPGESLPRWAIDILWRVDGTPMWRDEATLDIADDSDAERAPGAPAPPTDDELGRAESLCVALLDELGVRATPIPVFEDPWVAIRTEAQLPPDVDPRDWNADDDEERRRLARSLAHGLARPTAFVVPVQAQQGRWITAPWAVRRERIYLVPGDSPAGLRLPLAQLSGALDLSPDTDPTTLTRETPIITFQSPSLDEGHQDAPPTKTLTSALSIEVRDGVMFVFVPPIPTLDAFLAFVDSVERTAERLGVRVRLEGYAPPPDPRLMRVTVTPDPGVIEVNVPPSTSLRQHAEVMERLQDAARHAGLWCEKFLIDGRAVGTGGGNHVTLGGPSPLESPFLQQPALLGRLVRFLQHHPSLSYLFNGLFIGPTSQAPRVDEARLDSLAELELALRQIEHADAPAPWFVDRVLRNLLIDLTGNTHRTELCIDKLYSPDSTAGRLGIVELRAFEMPPHERMAVAQVLLMRSIVAALAAAPYDAPLVRWGTRLHDEFMLPHFLWADLLDVLRFLDARGFPLDAAWFRPFLDVRFPLFGSLEVAELSVEVRPALEPWPVLGEEPAGGGVARYVDSSLERLELRLIGGTPGRHVLAVNSTHVPVHATADPAVRVAGVRFRAWQPPHCLQPHIPVHHPLRIDLVDLEQGRSLAGCTYHVWHPSGRAFTDPPLTASEAAARRAMRFTRVNHTPGELRLRELPPNPDSHFTADLRWGWASEP